MRLILAALAALALVCPQIAEATDWSASTLGDGQSHWSETASADSGQLTVRHGAYCDNTHASGTFTVWASSGGTKSYQFFTDSIPAATSCPIGSATPCSKFWLPPGTYIMDPDSTAAAATCTGDK